MSEATHDVVIVGAGVAGALIAKRLTAAGLKVLMLEAGPASTQRYTDYLAHLDHFHAAAAKGAESPWPPALGAPQPDSADLALPTPQLPATNGYFIQRGPQLYGSTYTRTLGGSTLHWLGVSLRMLPEDFRMRTLHGVARDWPLDYATLAPYYEQAEHEIGVSADVEEQRYHGLSFRPGYNYPMRRIPPSYSDQKLAAAVDGLRVPLGDDAEAAVRVRTYPAGRNSTPRRGYEPVGAVDLVGEDDRDSDAEARTSDLGGRCQGNTSCTPICPVQAKYNAGKSLAQADRRYLTIVPQAVACRVEVDGGDGRVTGIRYQHYADPKAAVFEEKVAVGRFYVLATHAVENAKLMLASDLGRDDDALGRNLMDHPALYAWGLAPAPWGAFRGPQSSSGIEEFRGGRFRARHAAFRFDIGNDGWRASTGAPDTTVADAVLNRGLFGAKLRDDLAGTLPRQVRMSLAVEQLPDPGNRVTIDPAHRDAFGNPRPVIDYRITDYTLAGMAAASEAARAIFAQAGITDCSKTTTELPFPAVDYAQQTFRYHGMGHFAGTHAMGADPASSVVDPDQRAWRHCNLFVVGSGSFPTMGTSNPTLTLAALALRTADRLITDARR